MLSTTSLGAEAMSSNKKTGSADLGVEIRWVVL